MPREAVRSFTRALKIVPNVWGRGAGGGGGVELLLARAQVLSRLGKHEACAEVGMGGGGTGVRFGAWYSFVACLSQLTIDHASLSRRGGVYSI